MENNKYPNYEAFAAYLNTFEEPENVTEEAFTAYEITEKGLKFTIPACSVVAFRVK